MQLDCLRRLCLWNMGAAIALGLFFCPPLVALGEPIKKISQDAEDCTNAELLLRLDADRLVAACKRAAEQGFASAQFRLGWLYDYGEWLSERGKTVVSDNTLAADWYRKAAAQGNVEAQYHLGVLYQSGAGVPRDFLAGIDWFKMAAEEGFAPAQHALGAYYSVFNPSKAFKWYELAAEQGFSYSEAMVGASYFIGQIVTEDDLKGEQWLLRAAEQDVAEAQFNLGVIYARGPKPDQVKALAWLMLAAADGYPRARGSQERLSLKMSDADIAAAEKLAKQWTMRIDNKKRPPTVIGDVEVCSSADLPAFSVGDPDSAFEACQRLAEHGNPPAQLSVAYQYFVGSGVPADEVQAYAWATLAAASMPQGKNQDIAETLVNRIEAELTPGEVEEGRRRAAQWEPKVNP